MHERAIAKLSKMGYCNYVTRSIISLSAIAGGTPGQWPESRKLCRCLGVSPATTTETSHEKQASPFKRCSDGVEPRLRVKMEAMVNDTCTITRSLPAFPG